MLGPPQSKNPPDVAAPEGSKQQSGGYQLKPKDSTRDAESYAQERYSLHGQIRRLLIGAAAKSHPGTHAGNVYRTAACTWVPVGSVALVKPADRESYHYKGLATCGSVHACPICASKIQERRRQEVALAIVYAGTIERAPFMVSYTFPHRVTQPLAELLKLQQAAIKKLRESRGYVALMLKAKSAGRIRSLEVTHGQNGWHPHTHELLFLAPEAPAAWLREELAVLWFKACAKVGLFVEGRDSESDFMRYSVDVRAGDLGAAEYLAKMDDQRAWGLSHEMTKSSSKQGRRSGVHPFKLAAQANTSALFLEYVQAMKGQRQLVWSRGLKNAVGIEEKTDRELVDEEQAKAADRIELDRGAWRHVLGNDARWEVVHAARIGGRPAVIELLRLLGYQPEPSPVFVAQMPDTPSSWATLTASAGAGSRCAAQAITWTR